MVAGGVSAVVRKVGHGQGDKGEGTGGEGGKEAGAIEDGAADGREVRQLGVDQFLGPDLQVVEGQAHVHGAADVASS